MRGEVQTLGADLRREREVELGQPESDDGENSEPKSSRRASISNATLFSPRVQTPQFRLRQLLLSLQPDGEHYRAFSHPLEQQKGPQVQEAASELSHVGQS